MTSAVVLHPLLPAGPDRTAAPTCEGVVEPRDGPLPCTIVALSGPEPLLDALGSGLPPGIARAEALAVRARGGQIAVRWGAPRAARVRSPLELGHARGASSVTMVRADPPLLAGMQLGSWWSAPVWLRFARRLASAPLTRLPRWSRLFRSSGFLADLAFWAGARAEATPAEWRRLTRSSYVALYYHRLAGERKPGQERLDVAPRRFSERLTLLRRLRFHALSPSEQISFHAGGASVPRRSYVVTVDDGFQDVVDPLMRHVSHRPQLFVPTDEVGGRAWWADGEPLARWDRLRALHAAGVTIGSHSASHAPLPALSARELERSLANSHRELVTRLASTCLLLAYPHGRHDHAVRAMARAAGYALAYTTEPGRNGAGTPPYALRRVGVKDWDTRASFMFKVLTGRPVPYRWDRRLQARWRAASRPRSRLGRDR